MEYTDQEKLELLSEAIGEDTEEIVPEDWLILTDEEADEALKEYIRESVVYFRSSFLSAVTGLPEVAIDAVQKSEDNEAMLSLVEATCGLDMLVRDAEMSDGRGHFLSSYDGEELELANNLYAYRIN